MCFIYYRCKTLTEKTKSLIKVIFLNVYFSTKNYDRQLIVLTYDTEYFIASKEQKLMNTKYVSSNLPHKQKPFGLESKEFIIVILRLQYCILHHYLNCMTSKQILLKIQMINHDVCEDLKNHKSMNTEISEKLTSVVLQYNKHIRK